MTKRRPAGSEWRKWDLHVHLPGTKLSDGYEVKDGRPDWDRFADIIEASDVAVVGVTDYFCASDSLAFIKHFRTRHPKSEKLLLVNVELRLNETVNGAIQMVDFHVIFSDAVTEAKIQEFLSKLDTQITDANDRPKSCNELTGADYTRTTVTREDIKKAFRATFGDKADPAEHLIYVAPANNNGLRAEAGNQRKANLADEIDKFVHAIFGKDPSNAEYYLKTNRYEDPSQQSKPTPVFGGCDAHNFTDLEQWLGKSVSTDSTRQVVTWVKADPTFEGLQQTLVEPGDRVALSDLRPDDKDPYKVIRKVTFRGSTDFPAEIVFNPNLNAIIGSRSSGKSALLAHIAHAIDPVYTISQQMVASNLKESDVGPAAGFSWNRVHSTVCTVEWADGSTSGGSVIYIPQNWLYQISDNPREVTDKIEPVLQVRYPDYFRYYERQQGAIKAANDVIGRAVARWFELAADLDQVNTEIRQVGDKASITKARDDIKLSIETLRVESALSAVDLEQYQTIVNDIASRHARLEEIEVDAEQVQDYVAGSPGKVRSVPGAVAVETYLTPRPDDVPEQLAEVLAGLIDESDKTLVTKAEAAIVAYRTVLAKEAKELVAAIKKLEKDNKDLLSRHKANATLDELVKRQKAQQDSLDKIGKLELRLKSLSADQDAACAQIVQNLAARGEALAAVQTNFGLQQRVLDELIFHVAVDFDEDTIRALSQPLRKNEKGTFLKGAGEAEDRVVDVAKAHGDPKAFMVDLYAKKQKLNQGYSIPAVAQRVLTATSEVRFMAELDADRIGGFERPR